MDTERLSQVAEDFLKKGQKSQAEALVSAMETLNKSQRNQSLSERVANVAKDVEREGKGSETSRQDAALIKEVANNLRERERRKEQMQGFVQEVDHEVQMLTTPQPASRPFALKCDCSPTKWCSPSFFLVLIIIFLISGWFLWGGAYMYSHREHDVSRVQPKHVAPMILISVALIPMMFLKAKSPEEEQYEEGASRAWMHDEHNVWLRSLDRTLLVVSTILLVFSGLATMFFLCQFDFFMDPTNMPKNETQAETDGSKDKDDNIGLILILASWLLAGSVISRWVHIHTLHIYRRRLTNPEEGAGGDIEMTPLQ